MAHEIIRPTINNNGTSAQELIGHRIAAKRLIDTLIKELNAITPNGRDYPNDPQRCRDNRATH